MLTVIIKRNEEPKVIQMTQSDIIKQLDSILGAEILLEDTWLAGLRKVRTPYVCLVEADCTLSASYLLNNYNLLVKTNLKGKTGKGSGGDRGGGGYTKIAMLASCLGVKNFGNRIYNYKLTKVKDININGVTGKSWHVQPHREGLDIRMYMVQVGFVPGAVLRMSSIKDAINKLDWDESNLVKMSTDISFYLWGSGRRVALNPSTTYVTTQNLEKTLLFDVKVPDMAANIFQKEYIGEMPHNV